MFKFSWLKKNSLIIFLVIVFLFLQYKLWLSPGGFLAVKKLKHELEQKQQVLVKAQQENKQLLAQLQQIQASSETVEAHARYDLGMVKADEEYLQIVSPREQSVSSDGSDTSNNKQQDSK